MTTITTTYPEIPVADIVPNPEQPRTVFDPTELEELAASIREHGVIQPISVEECGDGYILHDGERRLRAAKMAGLERIPAIVSPPLNGTGPRERLERALVANIQRSQMSPIEEGRGYHRMMKMFGYSVRDISQRVGKSYTHVHYRIQLVTLLEPEIQDLMLEKKLPCADPEVLKSFLRIPTPKARIALARALAERNATARMIRVAVQQYLDSLQQAEQRQEKRSKRAKVASEPTLAEKQVRQAALPEWDALYQLGKVPPWPVVTEAVMATCDTCPIRHMASPATCSSCALVVSLRKMMEAVHANA